jgi:hypothetical protein
MYPAWFGAPSDDSARWFPDHLAFDFVEATIAELTRRGETGDTPNDAVEIALLRLLDYLDTKDSRLACARRVSHVMTADRKELTIAGSPSCSTGSSRRPGRSLRSYPRRIRRTTANDRSHSPGPKPPWSATRPDPFNLARDAERPIERLLLALRLLYGATTADIYQASSRTGTLLRTTGRPQAAEEREAVAELTGGPFPRQASQVCLLLNSPLPQSARSSSPRAAMTAAMASLRLPTSRPDIPDYRAAGPNSASARPRRLPTSMRKPRSRALPEPLDDRCAPCWSSPTTARWGGARHAQGDRSPASRTLGVGRHAGSQRTGLDRDATSVRINEFGVPAPDLTRRGCVRDPRLHGRPTAS